MVLWWAGCKVLYNAHISMYISIGLSLIMSVHVLPKRKVTWLQIFPWTFHLSRQCDIALVFGKHINDSHQNCISPPWSQGMWTCRVQYSLPPYINCVTRYTCFIFPQWDFSDDFSNFVHNYTCCICTFLHCVLSNVHSNRLHEKMHGHTGRISFIFLHCVCLNVSAKHLPERTHSYNGCTFFYFFQCATS